MTKARAVTGRAGLDRHELGKLVAHHVRRGFAVTAADHGQDAFKRQGKGLHFAPQVFIFKDAGLVRAVHQFILKVFWQVVVTIVQGKAVGLQEAAELTHEPRIGIAAQGGNGPVGKGLLLVRQDEVRIDFHRTADTRAVRAGAKRTVEGKEMGLDFRQADMAVRAGKVLAEGQYLFRGHAEDVDDAVGQFGRRFQGIGETHDDAVLDDQAVDDDVDSMLFILI